MSIAEQKMELFRFLVDADEETTRKLIEFTHQLINESNKFSEEEIAMFEKRRNDFFASVEKGYTVEESMDIIENNKFSEADLTEFNRRREEYLKNPDNVLTAEEV